MSITDITVSICDERASCFVDFFKMRYMDSVTETLEFSSGLIFCSYNRKRRDKTGPHLEFFGDETKRANLAFLAVMFHVNV